MDRRWVRPLGMTLSAATVISAMAPMQVMANTSTNFDYRKKVIGLSGIMTITGEMTANVTRAQFARMLVRASAYRGVLTDTSNVSVFADVKSGDEYAAAIRIAAEKGWMTGYLGGNFRPSQYVTLNEAAKGILYLLGYTAEDFDGDQYNKRMAQYAYLDLNENISQNDPAALLTKSDCVNLFYNLMKAKQKNGSEYAYVLDAEIDSDGQCRPRSQGRGGQDRAVPYDPLRSGRFQHFPERRSGRKGCAGGGKRQHGCALLQQHDPYDLGLHSE